MTDTTKNKTKLRVAAMGGLNESGKNCWLLAASEKAHPVGAKAKDKKYDQSAEYLILDAGNNYPGYESPGVDFIIPELKFLDSRKEQIQALVLTNVHESHSGAAHHIIKKLDIKKVIGSKLAIEQVKDRLDEELNIEWIPFESRENYQLGKFSITPFYITSSAAESYACSISAGNNKIFYSSTYKIDQTRSNGIKSDISGMLEHCMKDTEDGRIIDLYIGCSAGVENEGYSLSEMELIPKFQSILKRKNRVIFNTYSSCTIRIQNIIRAAEEAGRKIALHGQEIKEAFAAAIKAGCIEHENGSIISIKEVDNYKDSEILIICSAPEGDALRELEQICHGRSLEMELKEGDVLINSADPAPGTVRIMADIADQCFLKNVEILGGRNANLHSKSQAYTEEMKYMFNIIRPKYFLPAIGETRHLVRHAQLAVQVGFDPAAILMLDNGDVLELADGEMEVVGKYETGEILVNHQRDFHVDDRIIKERESIALEGVVSISFSLNKKRRLVAGPTFTARACTFSRNKEWKAFCLMNSIEITNQIETLANDSPNADIDEYQKLVREYMSKVIKQQIGKKPVVIVFANEV